MKINSFEEACEKLGLIPGDALPEVSKQPEWLQTSSIANTKLDVIAEAMREGKTLGPGDGWYPVFDEDDSEVPSGFGFSGSGTSDWNAFTDVGARRKLLTEEDADHFGKHFIELHRDSKCIIPVSEEVKGE